MRTLALCLALLLATEARVAAERVVTDSAGRAVTVPDTVSRVFAAGPPASVLVYVVAPKKLLGWPRAATPAERPYLAAPYRDLPELGRLTGHDPRSDTDVDEVDLVVTRDADRPAAATIRGSAADLDLWLWHRRDAEGITREGDEASLAALDRILAQAID